METPRWVWNWITPSGLAALVDYKYTGLDLSILVELFLRSFWNYLIEFFPLWIAPNMITTIGFFFLSLNYVVGLMLCPNSIGNCSIPAWFYVFSAWNLFVYQTMDNLDGKQARRTYSSSALGELFDHGCDSLFIWLMTICVGNALDYTAWEAFVLLLGGTTIFYSSHWEEYFTNNLILGRYANPTEAQIAMIVILLIPVITGPGLYLTKLSSFLSFLPSSIGSITLSSLTVVFVLAALGYVLVDNYIKVFDWMSKNGVHHELKEKSNKSIVALAPMTPLIICHSLIFLWAYNSKYDVVNNQTTLLFALVGILSSHLCNQLVISRITRMQLSTLNPILIFPAFGAMNVTLLRDPILPEEYLLPITIFLLAIVYIYFVVSVSYQLSHHLKIKIFSIPYPPVPPSKKQ